MKIFKLLLLLSLILILSMGHPFFASERGVVRVLVFYSEGCEYCARVHHVLDSLKLQYKDRLDISRQYDITDPIYGEVLDHLETRFGGNNIGNAPPIVFLGARMLYGKDLSDRLPEEIYQAMKKGVTSWPVDLESLVKSIQSSNTVFDQRTIPINIAYFYSEGCKQCTRAHGVLERIKKTYPDVTIRSFSTRQHGELQEALAIRYTVPKSKRLFTPSVFLGDSVLQGADISFIRLKIFWKVMLDPWHRIHGMCLLKNLIAHEVQFRDDFNIFISVQ